MSPPLGSVRRVSPADEPTRGRRRAATATPGATVGGHEALTTLGLATGDAVRFRRGDNGRWLRGTAQGRHGDGSLDLRDERGRSRAIPVDDIEVAERGPRGGRVWTPLAEVAARVEQLDLFSRG